MRVIANRWVCLAVCVAAWSAAGWILFGDESTAGLRLQGSAGGVNNAGAETPQRIVSMAPSLTEILFALGLNEKIVGVTEYSDYPPAANEKPVIGTFWQPDIEAVVAARPDMVVTETFDTQTHLAQRLRRLGYRTLSVDVWTVADLYTSIETIGQATGCGREADALLKRMKDNIAQVSVQTAAGDRPKVLYVIQTQPFRAAGRQTFINELIELAGGVNAIGPTVQKYPPIGAEHVIASAPDVIIAPKMAGVRREALLARLARYPRIPAVVNDRVYVIDDDTVSRLSPRIDEAVATLARCIRP